MQKKRTQPLSPKKPSAREQPAWCMQAQMKCKYAFNLPCIHICLATYYLFAFSHMAFKSSRVHFTRRDFLGSSFLIVVFFWLQIRRKLRQLHNYIHHKPLNQPYTIHHSTRVASMRAQSKAVLRVQFSAPQETANLFRVP